MDTHKLSSSPEKINSVSKKCTKCGEEKPVSEFHKDKSKKDGHRSFCKKCKSKVAKEYSIKNKEKIKEKKKKYYKENSEKISAKAKKIYEKNKEKIKEKSNQYYLENKEKIKKYREENKEKIKELKRKYNKKNKEKISKRHKEYCEENKEKLKKQKKKYSEKNKEFLLKKHKEYRQTDAGKAAILKKRHKRRALKLNATIENFNPIDVFKRDQYICQSCNIKTRPDYKNPNHPKYPNLDHIIPLSKGGEHSMRNTQCLCHKCNCEKKNNQKNDQLLMFGY